jgi:hypothetical protein
MEGQFGFGPAGVSDIPRVQLRVQVRSLQADAVALTMIRKRFGACIQACLKQGLIEWTGQTTDHSASGPYKLWRSKRGG